MAKDATKKSGTGGLIVTAGALTVLAVLCGGLSGKIIGGKLRGQPAGAGGEQQAEQPAARPYAGDTVVRELPAIIANLADPAEARVRLQVAIVYSKKSVDVPDLLAAQVSEDVLAYVKTLSVAHLQGASGLQALREDLKDRAASRSDGKIREVMIENLVVQ